jgi:hypothetical protein
MKVIIITFFILSISAFSKDSKPSNIEIEITTNESTKSAMGWKIENDMLFYNLNAGSYDNKISLDEIQTLSVKVGTHRRTGLLWGFGVPFIILNSMGGANFFGFTIITSIGAGAAGALIGYFINDWEDINLSKYKTKDTSFNFSPIYLPISKGVGVNFSVSF